MTLVFAGPCMSRELPVNRRGIKKADLMTTPTRVLPEYRSLHVSLVDDHEAVELVLDVGFGHDRVRIGPKAVEVFVDRRARCGEGWFAGLPHVSKTADVRGEVVGVTGLAHCHPGSRHPSHGVKVVCAQIVACNERVSLRYVRALSVLGELNSALELFPGPDLFPHLAINLPLGDCNRVGIDGELVKPSAEGGTSERAVKQRRENSRGFGGENGRADAGHAHDQDGE